MQNLLGVARRRLTCNIYWHCAMTHHSSPPPRKLVKMLSKLLAAGIVNTVKSTKLRKASRKAKKAV